MPDKTFFLTTPIYYPNARPHVGSAYTTIVCDVIARYKRMCGYDVAFLTGTDEHGEKLARAAAAEGKSPREFVEEKRKLFVNLWEKLGIPVSVYPDGKPDTLRFIYTTHPDHQKTVRRMLLRAMKNDYITKRLYEGRYCVSDERYISDGSEPANCDICGRPAELISEENYFFKLSEFGGEDGPLMRLYNANPGFVQPAYRMNEVKSFVRSGLRDISVSRKRIKWGFPFPLDEDHDDPEQVVYVWYDALTSYMTGIGYAQGENGSGEFQKYWHNDAQHEIVHMIGKDILRFHAVYWPAFLMAAGLPLPKTIFAHGWIYYEEDKMSKSKGNVVYPEPIIEALDSFGAPGNDAMRYYLLREATFGQDMSFSYDGLIERYNSDLANDFGNLANRTLTMLNSYFDGIIPSVAHVEPGQRELNLKTVFFGGGAPEELAATQGVLFAAYPGLVKKCVECFNNFDFSNGLAHIWHAIYNLNVYLVFKQPWNIANDRDRALVLYTTADLLRTIGVLVYPCLPQSAERLWKQLGCEGQVKDQRLDELKWGELKPGTNVGRATPIFPRLDREKTLAKLHELAEADYDRDKPKGATITVPSEVPSAVSSQGSAPEPQTQSPESRPPAPSPQPPAPSTSQISIDDFAKVDMRVGEILTAERVPNAQKLLKLTVDIGSEVRQVVAGLAEHYEPEKLIGMKVVLVANLQPRKLRGIESNGMIVAASVGEGGRPVLVTFKEEVPKGARLK